MADTETGEVAPEEIIALPPSEEGFDPDAVPTLVDLVNGKLREYVHSQAQNDEPLSLLGFALEVIYQAGYDDGQKRRR